MSKLATFFDHYRRALATGDVKTIASAYGDHFLVSGPGGQKYLKNNRAFKKMLVMSDKFYRQVGVQNVKITRFDSSVMDKHHAGVQVEWQLLDFEGKEMIRHDVSYIIYVDHKGIRIIFFVSHNEEERWQAAGYL
jgi:hypothetical protein